MTRHRSALLLSEPAPPSIGLAIAAPMPVLEATPVPTGAVRVDGKHFAVVDERFLFRGVTYGTFRSRETDGALFPERDQIKRDFVAMREAGFTVARTYTEPPPDLLDLAGDWGLRVLAGLFWSDWRYLIGASRRQAARAAREAGGRMRAAARRLQDDDRVLAVSVGNELPADVIRWIGTRRTASMLSDLVEVVREEDPERLVTYANYPTAEYLAVEGIDFLTFNVFLEEPDTLRSYLTRLHHLAGDRPLVLGEVGLDAGPTTEGEQRQAASLDRQLGVALERAVGGTCVFAWTDEWWVADQPVTGWHFGLTRADRSPRPAFEVAARWNRTAVSDLHERWPTVSVVICAYNAATTLDECLRHTCALDYPGLEIIVVDDGSTDHTADIARRHPRVRLVSIDHGGLGVARNAGLRAATGEIVAYLDADAYPTPEWPYYLALAFDSRTVGGVGGPNVPPPDDPVGAQVVAQSPGGPVHVLLSDDRAEHVPGCNMAFWRDVAEQAGGCDPIYRSAGDDVDLCWKVLDLGWEIGFHPGALVWHHRRPGLRPYLRQQRGYGRSEALVEARHPDRFSMLGSARWRGRIYNPLLPLAGRQRIYRGAYGTAAYQTTHRADGHGLDLAHQGGVPIACGVLASAPLGALHPLLALPAAAGIAVLVVLGVIDAARARPPAGPLLSRLRFRCSVAVHHLLQPVVRAAGRREAATTARQGLPAPLRLPGPARSLGGGLVLVPDERPRHVVAATVAELLRRVGMRVTTPTGWEHHDGEASLSALLRGELITSNHPPGCTQLRIRLRPRSARVAVAAAVTAALLLLAPPITSIAVAATVCDVGRGWHRSRRLLPRVVGARRS